MVAFLAFLLGGLVVVEDGKLTPCASSHHDQTSQNGPPLNDGLRVSSS